MIYISQKICISRIWRTFCQKSVPKILINWYSRYKTGIFGKVSCLIWCILMPREKYYEYSIQPYESEQNIVANFFVNLSCLWLVEFHPRINTELCWMSVDLTHWGRVTHICVTNLTIIGSNNGLPPGRCQAIIWTNAGILLIGTSGTKFSGILIEIHTFSINKMHLKMSFAKRRLFLLGLNLLRTRPHFSRIRHDHAFIVNLSDFFKPADILVSLWYIKYLIMRVTCPL